MIDAHLTIVLRASDAISKAADADEWALGADTDPEAGPIAQALTGGAERAAAEALLKVAHDFEAEAKRYQARADARLREVRGQ